MTRRATFLLVLLSLLCAAGIVSLQAFEAAVAMRIVTPDPLLPVSGGVGPPYPVREKKGDLTARAIVLQSGSERLAIVGTDFLGFPSTLGDRIRDKVPSIPPENILIGATHTHSAPDPYGFPDGKGGHSADLKYLQWVCDQAADAVNEAVSRLQPAAVKIASGEVKGKVAFNAYAEALFDPRCSVLQVLDADGRPFGTLVNYAVHPEVLGPRAGVCSPDLVGPLCDRLKTKGAGTTIFMNGALGGMVTADNRSEDGKDVSTWEECQRIGWLLADEVLRILKDAPIQSDPAMKIASRTIAFPVDSPLMRQLMQVLPIQHGLNNRGEIETQLNLVNLGRAQMLTIPGEALPNIGAYLKRNMDGDHPFLFGLTNDAFGYILTREDWGAFPRYEYISRTSLGERTGEIYVREALRMIADFPLK